VIPSKNSKMTKMSQIRTISIEFQFVRVWLTDALFAIRLHRIVPPIPSARAGSRRLWFSTSNANDFELDQLARNEYYKSIVRMPVAR
jgi:hypothetical protein